MQKNGHTHAYLWDISRTQQLLAHVGKQCLSGESGLTGEDAVVLGMAIEKTAKFESK